MEIRSEGGGRERGKRRRGKKWNEGREKERKGAREDRRSI